MTQTFDLVVVGTGSAAATPAYRCRDAGWRVAVVDQLPYGGTCSLRGCDPKKVLVGAAELADWTRRMSALGLGAPSTISWPDLMRFKRTFTDPVPRQRERAFQQAGIATYHGVAHFVGPDAIVIGDQVLRAGRFLVAAGARPRRLGIPGGEHVRTSTDFMEMDELPERIAFIGAGYISFELAHVALRAGAKVLIAGRGRGLPQFEPELVERLVAHTRELGVDVRLEAQVAAVEQRGGGYRLRIERGGEAETADADLVFHGAGRVPNTEELDLGAAGIAAEPDGGVRVNEFLQSTTNPRVYAAGDAAASPGSLPLTPIAGYHGRIVASNLLEGNRRTPEYAGLPTVVFTVPALARVGLGEAEARADDGDVRAVLNDTSGWYSNRRIAETCAMSKVIVDASDRVVGAHLLGPHAEEVINLFALAIRAGVPATELKQQIYVYPTSSSDVPYMV
jgi:glutathione reductase (NADPH)